MPIFDFRCSAGHKREHFFLNQASIVDEAPCKVCGEPSTRVKVGRFSISGPIWSDLDQWSEKLGRPVTDHRDIKAWEAEHQLAPMSAYEARVAKEEAGHISSRIKSVAREHGTDAAADVVEEINMCEGMGWTKERYQQFKESDNEAHRIQSDIGDVSSLPTPGLGDG
jgi:hypothetical protein